MNARIAATKVLDEVSRHGRSLSVVLPQWQTKVDDRDRALLQELCYGVLRWYPRLNAIAEKLLQKSLKAKDNDIRCLMLLGLYQLIYLRIPDHAAVSETVAVTAKLKKSWARGVVNAVLRNFQRRQDELLAEMDETPVAHWAHPEWLINALRQAYPEAWQAILGANNQYPPMCLRVNCNKVTRESYQQILREAEIESTPTPFSDEGLLLERPVDVSLLPGFAKGLVSVQDSAAQLAAGLLAAQAGERILDACAAPGGKTVHVLERQPGLAEMVAVDQDESRLLRLHENLKRLQLLATVITGDASTPAQWWDGRQFDRIMLDAPCSASGVIRRHPDIKLLRHEEDIARLVELQGQILRALWPLLKPGGMLLYITCSVLPQENVEQLKRFCAEHDDVREVEIKASWGVAREVGRQVVTGQDGMDGFYYACLQKQMGR